MYSRIKSLGRQSIVYGIGGVLNQFVGLLLIPVYTRYLTPEDYGIVQLLVVTSAFVVIIGQLGLGSAVFRSSLYDKSRDPKTIYSTAFFALTVSGLLILVIGYTVASPVSRLFYGTSEYARLVQLMFATAALDVAAVVPMARLRIEERAAHYSLISVGRFGLRLLLNILFIVIWRRGAAGLVEANFIQSFVFAFFFVWIIKDQLTLHVSKNELTTLMSFGLPLVPALIFSRLLLLSDRFILNRYSDLTQVGLYSLGYRMASIISILVVAFQTAWPAIFFSAGRTDDAKPFYARVMSYFIFFSTFLALGVSVLAEDTLKIMSTDAFWPASRVVPLLCLSYVFYGAYFVANAGIQLKNKTYYIAFITAAAVLLQIGLNFLLIPHWGMMAAALNTAISYLALPILVVLISRQLFHVRYEYRRLLMIGVVATGIYFLSRLISVHNAYTSFLLRGLLAASFPLILALFGFYSVEEKRVLRRSIVRGWHFAGSYRKKRGLRKTDTVPKENEL